MKIETDKYIISSTDDHFTLQLKKQVKDSVLLKDKSKIGSEKLGEKYYYSNLESLYKGMSTRLILSSDDISSFEDISDLLEILIDNVKDLA